MKEAPEPHEMRFPDDFKGWKPLYSIRDGRYLVLESPDDRLQALIHLEDDHVAWVMDAVTGVNLYIHPVSLQGARIILEAIRRAQDRFDALARAGRGGDSREGTDNDASS